MTDVNSIGTSPAAAITRQPEQQSDAARQQRNDIGGTPPADASRVTLSVAAQQRLAAERAQADANAVGPEVGEVTTGLQQRIESLVGPQSLLETQNATIEASRAPSPDGGFANQGGFGEVIEPTQSEADSRRVAQQQSTATDPARTENDTDLTA